MCRWIAYVGEPVFVDEFVSRPCQSLVAQSRRCHEAKTEVNGDGFGLGWFGVRSTPGLFRDIRPAWSDENLHSLAHQIEARLFFAHVLASTGGATSRANCHPFVVGQMMFMHNGQVPGWERLRRRLEASIPDELFSHRQGTTDSEVLFLALLARGLERNPQAAVAAVIHDVEQAMAAAGIAEPLKLTAAFTDGQSLHAVRYATDGVPPTLYAKRLENGQGALLVSEPLDAARTGWTAVAPQSFVTVTRTSMSVAGLEGIAKAKAAA